MHAADQPHLRSAVDLAGRDTTTTKGLADSAYSLQEILAAATATDTGSPGSKDMVSGPEDLGSPSKSHVAVLARACGISKSDSTTSARTHRSIPVTGAFPLGTLKVHEVDEPAESTSNEEGDEPQEASAAAATPPAPPPKCLDKGDCFIIIDLPDKFTVGLDTIALTTSNGRDFEGFRDIPPGPHFLWMSEPGAISRCGYWFVTGHVGEVRVKQWDRYNEVLGDAASHFEELEQRKGIEATYPRLMPHNYHGDAASTITPPPLPPKDQRRDSAPDPDPAFTAGNLAIWYQLTSAITPPFLSRVTGKKAVSEWLIDTTDGARGDTRFQDPTKLIKSIVGSQLDFLFQQDIVDLQVLSITAGHHANDDTTPRILALLQDSSQPSTASQTTTLSRIPPVTESDILAELQFTFLTGLHLGNYTCIEQWWHLLLKLLLRAHGLVLSHPALVRAVLHTLHAQLAYNERYIDHAAAAEHPSRSTDPYHTAASAGGTHSVLDAVPRRNRTRLREALTAYKRRLNQALLALGEDITPEQAAVGRAFADLEAWFWRFGWDLRSDYDDDSAVGNTAEVGKGVSVPGKTVLDGSSDSEDEEYAPVVVRLDEDGREVGLVSFS